MVDVPLMHGAAWHPLPQLGGGKPACSRSLHSLKHHRVTHPILLKISLLPPATVRREGSGHREQPFPSCSLGLVQAADHSSKTLLFLPVGQNAAYS